MKKGIIIQKLNSDFGFRICIKGWFGNTVGLNTLACLIADKGI
jgi:hypothetical protein